MLLDKTKAELAMARVGIKPFGFIPKIRRCSFDRVSIFQARPRLKPQNCGQNC